VSDDRGGEAPRFSERLDRALEEVEGLDRIPERSISLMGVGVMVMTAAILLPLLPSFSGVGAAWSVVMLAGGCVVAVDELRSAGHVLSGVRLPRPLVHPLFPPAFAALVAVHAFHLLAVGIVPLLWLSAAVLLCWDQFGKPVVSSDGLGHVLDSRRAWRGYRRNVLLGTGLCLLSLFLSWGESGGWQEGGYDSRSRGSGSSGDPYDHNPAKYDYPGFEIAGRNQPFALFAVAALFALLVWAAYRRRGAGASRCAGRVALGLAGLLTLWGVVNAEATAGPILFLVGIGVVHFALWRIRNGEVEGPYDAAHVWARMRGWVGRR